MRIAVVAHRRKTLGGGLMELRETFARLGITDLLWYEVDKSRKAPKQVKRALDEGAERIFVWGGDGTVQRCLDVLAGTKVPMAVLPAGTGNLFATNLGIPKDIAGAVEVGLHGELTSLDVGNVNGERFGVMAGVGADALMIRDADRGLKDRLGRGAYLVTGVRNLSDAVAKVTVDVDGERFYKGPAGCVLVGNVGRALGGIKAFDDASPTDGRIDVAVVTARTPVQWSRVLTRIAVGRTANAKHVKAVAGRKVDIRLKKKRLYEIDGGDRSKVRKLKVRVEPRSLVVCVPADEVA